MKKKADELQQELMEQLPELQEIKKIGQRIAFYRKQRHMTQQKLAERVHISKSYLSKIESVGTDITFSLFLLYKLARALDMEAYQLLVPINEAYLYGSPKVEI